MSALNRSVKYVDVPYDKWLKEELMPVGLSQYVFDHISTMARLHAENRYDRLELGQSDMQDSTCMYVPSIGLAVVGDAVFNGTHPWLAGCPNTQKRNEWISALDKIESLNPRAVIAGHKRPGTDDDPRIIKETRQYIRDFDMIAESSKNARELYDQKERVPLDSLEAGI